MDNISIKHARKHRKLHGPGTYLGYDLSQSGINENPSFDTCTSSSDGFGGLVFIEVRHGGKPLGHEWLHRLPHLHGFGELLDDVADVFLNVVPHGGDDLLRRWAQIDRLDLETTMVAITLDTHESRATEEVVLAGQGLLVRPGQQRGHVVASSHRAPGPGGAAAARRCRR